MVDECALTAREVVRVLLIEDDPDDVLLIQEMLTDVGGMRLERVSRLGEGLSRLNTDAVDVVLLDLALPDSCGVGTLAQVLSLELELPVIVLTGLADESLARSLVRRGAQDYLVKADLSAPLLGRAIHYAIERRRAEQALQRSEERFRLLAENANDIVYRLRVVPEFAIEYISPSVSGLTGYTPDDYYADPELPWRIAHPDERSLLDLLRRSPSDLPQSVEMRWVRKDGRLLWTEHSLRFFHDAEGRVEAVEGIGRDITERRQTEDLNTRLATVLEVASEAVVITDPDGVVRYVNDAFRRMSGYAHDDVCGQHVDELWREDMVEEARQAMRERLRHGEAWTGQRTHRRKDGRTYHVRSTVVPIRNQAGQWVESVTIEQDISMELDLQERLTRAQRLEAVGQLAGGVAHDFNNLLSIVMSYGELLGKRLDAEDARLEDVHEILNAASRGAGLVRQLFAFSRAEAGHPQVVALNPLVRNLEKMLRRVISEDIALSLDLDETDCAVLADPSQVEQVLLNLVVNARDAMPRGGHLSIATREVVLEPTSPQVLSGLEPGGYVRLVVSDNGCGMDSATLSRIFDPFFTTKDPGRGTGLGLATVYGIVQKAKGDIAVTSQTGHGTTFEILWPQAQAEAFSLAQATPTQTRGAAAILLVEDEDALRTAVRRMLVRHGYQVLEASNGAEALLVADEHAGEIDLLLTDVVMPLLSGAEAAERLGQRAAGLRTLFMSGYTYDPLSAHGVAADTMQVLAKPFTESDLLAAVTNALEIDG